METLLKDKKFSILLVILLVAVSLFTFTKFVNEVKLNKYIGHNPQTTNSISFTGKGEITALSDIASLTVNIEKEAKTTKEAQKLLNESITKTLSYLKDKKIEDKDIKSEYGGLNPKYSYNQVACYTYPCPQNDPKIVGYTASQSITIKVREVDSASDIRTGLADLGITNISGPVFSIDNEDSLKDQARALAITDAKNKAEILAEQLGVSLGSVVSFSENTGGNYPMYETKTMMSASLASDSAPVLPKGENKISTNITITYELE
jgi:hypothetical protein